MDAAQARENRRVWDAIGPSFDATRDRPWAPVVQFLRGRAPGARVADLGCGNGRHLSAALGAGLRPVGLDVSAPLLRSAAATSAPVARGVLERPPFRAEAFDAAICIAAMHHVRGRGNRVGTWRALRALVRPKGRILASAWSTEARAAEGRRTRRPQEGPTEPGDRWVAWGDGPDPPVRFVHFYAADELAAELSEAGWSVERAWDVALTGGQADNRFVEAA